MAGWNSKSGQILNYRPTEDELWAKFNYVFSNSSKKRNTYKFGLIKAILDNLLNSKLDLEGRYQIDFHNLFAKFAENYWNLIVKYGLHQMRKNEGQSEWSAIEKIFYEALDKDSVLSSIEFLSIEDHQREKIINSVSTKCRRNVIGALYDDFDGCIYGFDLSFNEYIWISPRAYEFMLRYKSEIEKINYYEWAKFLEKINDERVLIKVIDKLELSTPRRTDLSVYRMVLEKEFEENTCFYCGRKLRKSIHVDHFIPWSFVKEDRLWNFVLSCPQCNLKKSDKMMPERYLVQLLERNEKYVKSTDSFIQEQFSNYNAGLYRRLWYYAKLSGLRATER